MTRVERVRLHVLGVLLAVSLTITGCSKPPPVSPVQTESFTPSTELCESKNRFAYDLFQRMRQEKGNLFVSPLSLSTALAMTAVGARGETAEQIAKVLHLNKDPQQIAADIGRLQASLLGDGHNYELQIANALWGRKNYPILEPFVMQLQTRFGAEARTLDFDQSERSRQVINQWVAERTKNRIREVLPIGSIDEVTRLILTNAIYFKGAWESKFDRENTHVGDFHVGAQIVRTPMMHRVGEIAYAETEMMQAVELPYQDRRMAMVILLPRDRTQLATLEATMNEEFLSKTMAVLRRRRVDLGMPRFKINSSHKMNEILSDMGMPDAFSPNRANLSGFDGTRYLFIAAAYYQGFCDVNEDGTEAAGSTQVQYKFKSEPERPVLFRANHPFLFLIRDRETGIVLFLGRLVRPEGEPVNPG